MVIRRKDLSRENREFSRALENRDYDRVMSFAAMVREWFADPADDSNDPSPELAEAFDNAAFVLGRMEAHQEEAEALYSRALRIRRALFGDRHHWVAFSMENLARLYRSTQREAEAVELERRAIEMYRERIDQASQEMALLDHRGAYEEALARASEVQDLVYHVDGPDSSAYAAALNNLAYLHKMLEDYDDARALYQEAVEIWRRAVGEADPDYAAGLLNLAECHRAGGDPDAAEPLLRQALDVFRALGEDQPNYAGALNNLAFLLEGRGEYAEAERLHRQALDILRRTLGEVHPLFAHGLNNLAKVYELQGNLSAAEPLYLQALRLHQGLMGHDHPETLVTLSNLLGLYQKTGDQAAIDRLMASTAENFDRLERERPYSVRPLPALEPLFVALDSMLDDPVLPPVPGRDESGQGEKVTPRSGWFQESLQALVQSFSRAEYASCYRMAIRLCKEYPCHEVLQLYLVACQRLGETTQLQLLADDCPELLHDEPWCLVLVRLSLGLADLGEVVAGARDEGMRCQAYFYAANRQLSEGDGEAAEELFRQCLATETDHFERRVAALVRDLPPADPGDETANEIGRLNGEVSRLLEQDRFELAVEPATRAHELSVRHLPETHFHHRLSLYNLAAVSFKLTDYARAAPLFARQLELERATPRKDETALMASLNGLGLTYIEMGQLARAEPLVREAVELARRAGKNLPPSLANNFGSLAEVYREMHDHAAAIPLYEEALRIIRETLGEEHHEYARQLNNLGLLYHQAKNLAVAEPLLQQALEVRRRVLGPGHPEVAQSSGALAALFIDRKQFAEAEALLQEASAINEQVFGEDHVRFAAGLNNLASLRVAQGRWAAAVPLLERAEQTYREHGEADSNRSQVLVNLALAYATLDRPADAFSLLEQTLPLDNRLLGDVFTISSERQRLGWVSSLATKQSFLLSLALRIQTESPRVESTAFDWVLRRKALTAEAQAAQRDGILGGRYPQLCQDLDRLRALRHKRARKAVAGPGPEGLAAHRQLLADWEREYERLEAELARQIPEMNLEQTLRAADTQTVAGALPEGTALVEFVRFNVVDFKAVPARGERQWKPAHYLAFVLLAEQPDNVRMIDLGEAEPIDRMIASFRDSIPPHGSYRHAGPHSPAPEGHKDSVTGLGSALREALFDPLLPALDGRRRLFVASDGDLARLPFEALPVGDGHHLIDEYEISYLGVGRDVLRFGIASTGQPTDPLVAADPDFDLCGGATDAAQAPGRRSRDLDRGSWHFGRLAGMREEGESIGRLLGVRPLLEGAVVEGRLKARRSPRILHIATHGFFLPDQQRDPNEGQLGLETSGGLEGRLDRLAQVENPLLRSGLALAGANTWHRGGNLPEEAEDGLLTAEDVTGMDLLDTELVVLSACETGLGQVHVGEGTYGLRRAFVLAGAKTLVMSLWKVDDEVTRELMEDFYRRLLEGESRAKALREAQRSIKRVHPHPYYWGAFICQGDPGPLSTEDRTHD